jgi:hypothetical protein
MTLRTLLRVAAPAAAAALALSYGLTATQAASTPGWRITKIFSPASSANLQDLVPVAKNDAWLAGSQTGPNGTGLLVRHWNGGRWETISVPSRFTNTGSGSVSSGPVGATSKSDAWVFPALSNGTTTAYYALHYNGSGWTTHRLRGSNGLFSTAVFGPTTKTAGETNQDMVAMHWNGRP